MILFIDLLINVVEWGVVLLDVLILVVDVVGEISVLFIYVYLDYFDVGVVV